MSCVVPTTNVVRARAPADVDAPGVGVGASSAAAGAAGSATAARANAAAAIRVDRRVRSADGRGPTVAFIASSVATYADAARSRQPATTHRTAPDHAASTPRDRLGRRLRLDERPRGSP